MDWSTILATLKLPEAALPPLVGALVGALVGGSLTLTGVVASQCLTHYFTRRREAEKLQREKAEALMDELFAQIDWLRTAQLVFYDASTQGATLEPPADRIRTLQWFYFPELQQSIEALYEARQACVTWFRTRQRFKGSDYSTWLQTHDPHLFDPVYEDFLTVWCAARDAVLASAESRSWLLRRLRRRSQKKHTPLK
jgi:hypothetical protein